MRTADCRRTYPQVDFTHKCSQCGEAVAIWSSGQLIIKQFGEANVLITCNRCVKPETVARAAPAPGALQEAKESIPNPVPFMTTWTVYHNPRDYPDKFVIRRWDILRGQTEPIPTSEHYVGDTLEEVREHVPFGLVCLPRYDDDDHAIVEVWL
jgi:hypothetical protein